MGYIIPTLIIGGAIYVLLMLLVLGLCGSADQSDRQIAEAYRNLRDGGRVVIPIGEKHEGIAGRIHDPELRAAYVREARRRQMPERNRVYTIHWRTWCGFEDVSEAVYCGLYDANGNHEWKPVDGSPTLYLFADEVLSIAEEGVLA